MPGNFKRENRETPLTSQGTFFELWERSENANGGTADAQDTARLRKTRRTQHALVFLIPLGSAASWECCVPPPRVPVPHPRLFRIGISQASSFISVYSGGLSSGLPGAPTARTTIVSTVAALPWRKLSRGRPSGKRSISSISMTSAGTHAGFSPPLIEVPWVTADLVVQKPISPRKHVNCRHRTAILTRYEWRH
jgi:hypothetical protein